MEGGLKKPERYTVDWKHPDYLNKNLFEKELRRVSEACHGCRRCVSLCNSFPTLFDLIDNSENFEVSDVKYNDFFSVIDHCYLCDLCFLTKCPYVPPHEWEIDFPHLMLRGKHIKFSTNKTSIRDKFLTSTDIMGNLFSRKIISNIINFFNKINVFRILVEKIIGIHRNARLPLFVGKTAKQIYSPLKENKSKNEEKIAIFSTCYHNYNEPVVIGDFIKILQYNNIDVELIKDDNCCGMPKLELGDLYTVEKMMHKNLKILLKYVEKGFKIIAPIPSCVLMFKQELPLLFPENTDLVKISKSFYDPFEFLYKLNNENKLNVNFKNELGKVFYHVSCHQRVQNIGLLTKKVLELIPNTNVEEIERCSGHDGTYGVKKETFEIAMKIVKPIKKAYEQSSHKIYTSDCSLAAHHIENSLNNKVSPTHPISLLRTAYGI